MHRNRILRLPTVCLAVILAASAAVCSAQAPASDKAPSRKTKLEKVTPGSFKRVAPPERPDSGRVLIQPGEPTGALAKHSGAPGRKRASSIRPEDLNGLLVDDSRGNRTR